MTAVEPGGNDDGSLITRNRGQRISGQTYFCRSLLGNSRGQHDLDDYAHAGDDTAGKQEPAADYPFEKPGFQVCIIDRYIASQGANISRYITSQKLNFAFQSFNIDLCRQLW